MKKVTKYISELGREFNTREAAILDDYRLLELIRIYKLDVETIKTAKKFGSLDLEYGNNRQDQLELFQAAVKKYEAMWQKAQDSWLEKE